MSETADHLRARGGWAEDRILGRSRPPFGPLNTWSNVAYAVAGVYLAAHHQDQASAAMAVALWLLATGSALYHSEKTLHANRLDWLGMMAVFGGLVTHAFLPRWPGASWLMLVGGGAAGYWYLASKRLHADRVIGAMLGLAALGAVLHGGWRWTLASLGVFAVAYGVWHLDRRGSPLVGRVGHALWHVLTAVAMVLMYQAAR